MWLSSLQKHWQHVEFDPNAVSASMGWGGGGDLEGGGRIDETDQWNAAAIMNAYQTAAPDSKATFSRLPPLLTMMLPLISVVKHCCRLPLGVEEPIVLQSAAGCHRTFGRQMAKG